MIGTKTTSNLECTTSKIYSKQILQFSVDIEKVGSISFCDGRIGGIDDRDQDDLEFGMYDLENIF
jgi:hypothetical protein